MPALTTSRSERAKRESETIGFDLKHIEKVTSELVDTLKRQLKTLEPKPGRRTLDFSVILDGDRIRLDSTPLKTVAKARTEKADAGFDPEEAGRLLVQKMQAAEGGAWTAQELEERFGLTPAALHKRRKEHRIVFWRDAKHRFHYPRWQFTETGALLPGIQEVLQTFRSTDEWRLISYFLAPREQLDGRAPLELLRAGEVAEVAAHARVHGAENSW